MKKILLAGPGTGKTRKVKVEFLKKVKDFEKVLILSFTNVTVNDLRDKFAKDGIAIGEKNCMTLHSFALKINHKRELHILNNTEEYLLKRYSTSLKIDFVLLCEMLNCISYDQMVISLVEFAKINSVYLKEQIGELELLIVDEYQDFNDFEQSLVNLISDNAEETLILGDDDQCIYDFKDATSDGIIALHSDASITKIPHENKCYRCPDTVVEKCTNLISNNKQRVLKDWHPTGIDGLVHFQQISTIPETIEWVSKKIKEIKEENEKTTILVLSPVKFAVEGLSEELDKNNIKNVNFFKDNTDMNMVEMIWKLRLVYSSKKLLNFLLLTKVKKLTAYQKTKFKKILSNNLSKSFVFNDMYDEVKEFIDPELIEMIENPPDFDDLLEKEPWNKLKIFFDKVENANNLDTKLERVSRYLEPPVIVNKEVVNIMSIYKSKGLEAQHVFILGVVDGIIPREVKSIEDIEKERRLLFVGMSRAEKNLYLISTVRWNSEDVHKLGTSSFTPVHRGKHYWNGRTSPFVGELKL